jgi:hypothetical protein
MILAQEVEDFLGLGGLGEGGVAAQIAEHDDDLSAMAFQEFFIALGDDQFGELRCEKPLQPSDPAQLFNLLRDPRLKSAVQVRDFAGALAQFSQEAGVLHCQHGLGGKCLQLPDLLIGEWGISVRNALIIPNKVSSIRRGTCSAVRGLIISMRLRHLPSPS